jgi:outer membrane lipoprotein carrier protein
MTSKRGMRRPTRLRTRRYWHRFGTWSCLAGLCLLLSGVNIFSAHYRAAFAAPAGGDAAPSGELDKIDGYYKSINSLSAEFAESSKPVGAEGETRTGKLYYRKPGQMRWEFSAPRRELIVSDGQTIYDYQPDLNQVIEAAFAQAFKSVGASAFLLGIGDLKRDFDISWPASPRSNGLIRLTLVPKGGSEKLDLKLSATTYKMVTLTVSDSVGDTTELHFHHVQSNLPLDDSLFTFVPPQGVDVVKIKPGQ